MKRLPNPLDAIIIFCVALIFAGVIANVVPKFEPVVIFLCFFTLPFLYCLVFGYDIKLALALRLPDFYQFLLVFVIAISSLWIMGAFAIIQDNILKQMGLDFSKDIQPLQQEVKNIFDMNLLFGVFLIAVVPSICEEIFFRGIVLTSFRSWGIRGLIYTAILFAVLHMILPRVTLTFLLGMIFGGVVLLTRSVFCGMFCHFVNNCAASFYFYFFEQYNQHVSVPVVFLPLSAILFVLSFIFLYHHQKNSSFTAKSK